MRRSVRRPWPPTFGRRDGLRALLGLGLAGAWAPVRAASVPADLLDALRAGGCVLLIRHARTDPGVGDPPGYRVEVCSTQRNLSDEGRTQAERLGAGLRDAGVVIGPVRSSRWCRCLDTARLAFGRVEPWPVIDSFFDQRDAEPAQTRALRAWVLGFRGPGNAALVTHQVNATALTGESTSMGEVLVLRPASGALKVLGRFGG